VISRWLPLTDGHVIFLNIIDVYLLFKKTTEGQMLATLQTEHKTYPTESLFSNVLVRYQQNKMSARNTP